MIINILNYQNGITNEEAKCYLDNGLKHLRENSIPCDNIHFVYNDKKVRENVDELINRYNNSGALLENFDFMLGINELFDETKKVVLLGINKEIIPVNLWGDALDIIAIIKYPHEKLIWHEVAHLIGADDHYDEKQDNKPKTVCKNEKCIMRYGILEGVLCDESLKEIKEYLDLRCLKDTTI